MMSKNSSNYPFSVDLLPGYILGIVGLFIFVWRGIDPWGWPDLDMASYYVSVGKSGAIVNDFFTSCFGDSNARAIFGLLTAWPIHLGLDWYKTLYLWMLINSVVLPAALYFGLQSSTPGRNNISAFVYFIFIAIAIFNPRLVGQLTVAWWSAWGTYFHPSVFSISLISLGVFILGFGRVGWKVLGSNLVFLSALVHPAYSLGGVIFFTVMLGLSREKSRAIILICSVFLGLVFVKLFSNSGALSVDEYYQYFSWLHPEHYIPSRFVAMGPFSWFTPFFLINLVLFCSGITLYLMRNKNASLIAFCFFVVYLSAVVSQYLFVEKYPIFKTLLLISPVRFTAFGYWMCVVSIAMLLIEVLNKINNLPLCWISAAAKFKLHFMSSQIFRINKYFSLVIFIFLFAALGVIGFFNLNTPQDHIDPNKQQLFDWIIVNTDPASEIASDGFLSVEIPLITGRGTYHGNGFPFEDRCLKENYVRYVNISGVPTGKSGRKNSSKFYAGLHVSDFMKMYPKPDWVVMDRESPGAIGSMSIQQPAFSNPKFLVFQLNQ